MQMIETLLRKLSQLNYGLPRLQGLVDVSAALIPQGWQYTNFVHISYIFSSLGEISSVVL